MEENLISLGTMIITIVLGVLSKKSKFVSNNLIPVQNLCIGLIIAIIHFAITKDFNSAIALSGLMAGGTYDIIHNLQKMNNEEDYKEIIEEEMVDEEDGE